MIPKGFSDIARIEFMDGFQTFMNLYLAPKRCIEMTEKHTEKISMLMRSKGCSAEEAEREVGYKVLIPEKVREEMRRNAFEIDTLFRGMQSSFDEKNEMEGMRHLMHLLRTLAGLLEMNEAGQYLEEQCKLLYARIHPAEAVSTTDVL